GQTEAIADCSEKDDRLIRFAVFAVLIWLSVGSLPIEAFGQVQGSTSTPTGAVSGELQPVKKPSLTFWQIIFSGGPLGIANMVVLIGLSITALALAADDLRIVRKSRLIPDGLSDDVRELVAAGELGQARSACLAQPSFLAAVIMHGLSEAEGGW